ncbi:MAG: hypothetical protein DMF62_06380 [Acidobacteria bacterium]|nr:MAG: hypothetical protein DMF62_06380 [Acidobacteriota bacterium]
MYRLKLLIILAFAVTFMIGCLDSKPQRYSITDSKAYEASLFRQNCAICHGPEGEGKTLEDGKQIPNLRQPPFKYSTDEQIYRHIAEGGNGMVPFRNQLSERELRSMVEFVRRDLRGN